MRQWAARGSRDSAVRLVAGLGVAIGLTACAVAEVDPTSRSREDAGDSSVTSEDASTDGSTAADVSSTDGSTGDGETSDSADDQTVTDAVTDAGTDAVTDAVTDGITGPCQTPPGVCAATLPVGWTLVMLQPNRDSACPENFTQQDVLSNPMAGAGACGCACTVNSSSACNSGTLPTRHDTTAACSMTGVTLNLNGSSCTALAGNFSTYFSATPPTTNATCTAATMPDPSRVTSTEMRACEVPSTCREDVCSGRVPAGASACVMQDGMINTCPAGWSNRSVVGTGVNLQCGSSSSCSCQGSATCTNPRIEFFSDGSCNTSLISFAVDGSCQATNGVGPIGSYSYSATAGNPQCTPTGSPNATVSLQGTRTLCCK